jgi:hypothetical protein
MLFGGKVGEESAFSDIGEFGDLLDGHLLERFLLHQREGRLDEALARLLSAALASTRTG